jgi:mannose-6-phosphate isomerase-like protein (cupin superfamily)
MKARRVVSGQDKNGKSRIISDEIIEGVCFAGGVLTEVWGGDVMPSFPSSGKPPRYEGYFPPAGGYRFLFNMILPANAVVTEDESAATQMSGGIKDALEDGENAGMHTTDSVDFIVITSGVAGLELDDGEKILLKQGDLFIQNGTRHRWFNPTNEPATFVAVLIGGVRS